MWEKMISFQTADWWTKCDDCWINSYPIFCCLLPWVVHYYSTLILEFDKNVGWNYPFNLYIRLLTFTFYSQFTRYFNHVSLVFSFLASNNLLETYCNQAMHLCSTVLENIILTLSLNDIFSCYIWFVVNTTFSR